MKTLKTPLLLTILLLFPAAIMAQPGMPTPVINDGTGQSQTIQPEDQIAVGAYHSVVLNDAGQVFTFGSDVNGVLGQGSEDKRMDLARLMEFPVLDGKTIVDVVFGSNNSALILTDEGKVYGWGRSVDYQFGSALRSGEALLTPTQITHPAVDTVHIVQITMGLNGNHSMLLTEDGEVLVMGVNEIGSIGTSDPFVPTIEDPTPIDRTNMGEEKVVRFARSNTHSLFLTESNKVFAVGVNVNGQLGTGTTTAERPANQIPQEYFLEKTILDVYAAPNASYALTDDGTLFSWGQHTSPLGLGELSADVLIPTQVTHPSLDGKAVASVSVSDQNTVMLTTTDGLVYVAGSNPRGILGIGSFDNAPFISWTQIPPAYFDDKHIVEISHSATFSLFRASDGTLFGAGYNAGTGYDLEHARPFPLNTTFIAGKTITRMVTSSNDRGYGLLLDSEGSGYLFQNDNRPFNIFPRSSIHTFIGRDINSIIDTPTLLEHPNLDGHRISAVKAGGRNTYLLTDEGRVFSFGSGVSGTLGTGDSLDVYIPELIDHPNLDGKKIVDVVVGWNGSTNELRQSHALLLTDDGTLFAMGSNASGQLGLGDTRTRYVPTPVTTNLEGKTIMKIAAAGTNSMAIISDGSVYLWGRGGLGEMGFGNSEDLNVPTLATHANIDGKKVIDGAVGYRSFNPSNPHFLILLEDHTLYSFGNNINGGLGIGNTTNTNVPTQVDPDNTIFAGETIVAVYAGSNNTSTARTASGKLFGWGRGLWVSFAGSGGSVMVPTLITSPDIDGRQVRTFSRNFNHHLALLDDGNLLSFGLTTSATNPYGAFGTGNTGTGEVASDYPNQFLPTRIPDFSLASSPIPTTNLVLHLDAGRGLAVSKDSLNSWRNLAFTGGDGFQSELEFRPVVVDSAINNRRALRFNGSNSFFNLPEASELGIQNEDYELFIVAKSSSPATQFLLGGETLEQHELRVNGDVGARFIPVSGQSNVVDVGSDGEFTDGSAQLFNVQATDTFGRLTINRSRTTVNNIDARSPNAGIINLGRRSDDTFHFDGDIAEIIIYTGQLSEAVRDSVEQYLYKKYAIQNYTETQTTLTGSEGWRLLASPVADSSYGSLLSNIWTQGFEGSNAPEDAPNVFTWNNSSTGNSTENWQPITNMNNTLESGTGMIVYVFSDDDPFDEQTDAGFPKTISVSGFEPGGDQDLSSTLNPNATGWSLLGNPFSSDIDWDEFTGKTNLSNSVYVWDGDTQDWLTWNGTTGSLSDGIIGAFSGFMVYTEDEEPTLTIPQSAKVADTPAPQAQIAGNQNAQTSSFFSVNLESKDGLRSKAWFQFSEKGNMGMDSYDAFKLTPLSDEYVMLASVLEKEDQENVILDINHLPISAESFELPLYIHATQNAEMSLSLADMNVPDGWEVALKNEATGQILDLNQPYVFTYEEGEDVDLRLLINSEDAGGIEEPLLPERFGLSQNYPNPFNPTTTIKFQLAEESMVRLEVYDILGRRVAVLVNDQMQAGYHQTMFDANRLASGVYFYRMVAGSQVFTQKMMLIK